ncbi:GntR family transcriptional regulator [Xylanibacillus composti]|uniref:GntR family transcriptional regulator n=1 Tax=Xylanibacillus composti TaxID=1572762 RepID=A0A8J4H1L9_9BACL|nr:GntR family transcriptional regulator [Xylanibacillus composti]MDT9724325.1 GntR family transcriptional regulator [Xylanibacillus composti]GIQ67915.1 GntR family transcriptional regulator [Xylanibacillus composti]
MDEPLPPEGGPNPVKSAGATTGKRKASVLLPAPRKTLGDHIYEQLREQIVHLQLEPGQMIYENEVADSLQVSRTPVREAFRLLANESLIDVLPQRGTRISLISVQKVSEARFVREHLESGAFQFAAREWSEQAAVAYEPKLIDLLERQRAAAEQHDAAGLLTLDETFHETVMRMTGNETLLQIIHQMRAHMNRARFLSLTAIHQMDQIIDEHEQLLDSIRARDETKTASMLADHLRKLDIHLPQLRAEYPHYFCD